MERGKHRKRELMQAGTGGREGFNSPATGPLPPSAMQAEFGAHCAHCKGEKPSLYSR